MKHTLDLATLIKKCVDMVQQPLHMYILEHLILDILYELGRIPSNQADKQKMNKSFSYEVN